MLHLFRLLVLVDSLYVDYYVSHAKSAWPEPEL